MISIIESACHSIPDVPNFAKTTSTGLWKSLCQHPMNIYGIYIWELYIFTFGNTSRAVAEYLHTFLVHLHPSPPRRRRTKTLTAEVWRWTKRARAKYCRARWLWWPDVQWICKGLVFQVPQRWTQVESGKMWRYKHKMTQGQEAPFWAFWITFACISHCMPTNPHCHW